MKITLTGGPFDGIEIDLNEDVHTVRMIATYNIYAETDESKHVSLEQRQRGYSLAYIGERKLPVTYTRTNQYTFRWRH